jgi:hypothetical protein
MILTTACAQAKPNEPTHCGTAVVTAEAVQIVLLAAVKVFAAQEPRLDWIELMSNGLITPTALQSIAAVFRIRPVPAPPPLVPPPPPPPLIPPQGPPPPVREVPLTVPNARIPPPLAVGKLHGLPPAVEVVVVVNPPVEAEVAAELVGGAKACGPTRVPASNTRSFKTFGPEFIVNPQIMAKQQIPQRSGRTKKIILE